MEVTLPRFLFVREARYYFNNGRKNGGSRETCTPNLSVKRIRYACPVQLPKWYRRQDLHPQHLRFELSASARLGYADK